MRWSRKHPECGDGPNDRGTDGPFTLLGPLDPSAVENAQLLRIDGVWHLLATTIPVIHHPRLYRLTGDPTDPQAWLHFELVRQLAIPPQRWNGGGDELSSELDNCAYLIDRHADDGYYYLLYAGSSELTANAGLGRAKLGLARSRDLIDWAVPPEAQ